MSRVLARGSSEVEQAFREVAAQRGWRLGPMAQEAMLLLEGEPWRLVACWGWSLATGEGWWSALVEGEREAVASWLRALWRNGAVAPGLLTWSGRPGLWLGQIVQGGDGRAAAVQVQVLGGAVVGVWEAALRGAGMMAAGQMARGLGHGFNNVLHLVMTSVQCLERAPVERWGEWLPSILNAVARGRSMVAGMQPCFRAVHAWGEAVSEPARLAETLGQLEQMFAASHSHVPLQVSGLPQGVMVRGPIGAVLFVLYSLLSLGVGSASEARLEAQEVSAEGRLALAVVVREAQWGEELRALMPLLMSMALLAGGELRRVGSERFVLEVAVDAPGVASAVILLVGRGEGVVLLEERLAFLGHDVLRSVEEEGADVWRDYAEDVECVVVMGEVSPFRVLQVLDEVGGRVPCVVFGGRGLGLETRVGVCLALGESLAEMVGAVTAALSRSMAGGEG